MHLYAVWALSRERHRHGDQLFVFGWDRSRRHRGFIERKEGFEGVRSIFFQFLDLA
jgi:hypothetical protein